MSIYWMYVYVYFTHILHVIFLHSSSNLVYMFIQPILISKFWNTLVEISWVKTLKMTQLQIKGTQLRKSSKKCGGWRELKRNWTIQYFDDWWKLNCSRRGSSLGGWSFFVPVKQLPFPQMAATTNSIKRHVQFENGRDRN